MKDNLQDKKKSLTDNLNKRIVILNIAANSFHKKGLSEVSMDFIAKECNISKKTIYTYFESKSQLLSDILDNEILNLKKYILTIRETAENPIHEIFMLFEYLEKYYRNVSPAFYTDLEKNNRGAHIQLGLELIKSFLIKNYLSGWKYLLYKKNNAHQEFISSFVRLLKLTFYNRNESEIQCKDINYLKELYLFYMGSEKGITYLGGYLNHIKGNQ